MVRAKVEANSNQFLDKFQGRGTSDPCSVVVSICPKSRPSWDRITQNLNLEFAGKKRRKYQGCDIRIKFQYHVHDTLELFLENSHLPLDLPFDPEIAQ